MFEDKKIVRYIGLILFAGTTIASFFYSPWETAEEIPLVNRFLVWGVLDIHRMNLHYIIPFLFLLEIQNIIFCVPLDEMNPLLRYFYESSFTYFSCIIVFKWNLNFFDYIFEGSLHDDDIMGVCMILVIPLLPELIHILLYFFSRQIYAILLGEYFMHVQKVEIEWLVLTIAYIIVTSLIIEWIVGKIYHRITETIGNLLPF